MKVGKNPSACPMMETKTEEYFGGMGYDLFSPSDTGHLHRLQMV